VGNTTAFSKQSYRHSQSTVKLKEEPKIRTALSKKSTDEEAENWPFPMILPSVWDMESGVEGCEERTPDLFRE